MPRAAVADLLARALAAAVAAGALPPAEAPAPVVDAPRDSAHGDYASNAALLLAKPMRRAPLAVAEAIAAHLPANDLVAWVRPAAPGFLNVRVADAWLRADLAARLAAGLPPAAPDLGAGAMVVLDHPSFAEALPLGLDAGRRAVAGEALAAVLARTGHRVVRASGPGAWAVAAKPAVALRDGTPVAGATLAEVVAAIGGDAARYLLAARPLDEAVALNLGLARRQVAQNPAFYVQYAHVRAGALVRLAACELPGLDPAPARLAGADLARLAAPAERDALLRVAALPDALAAVVRQRDPARLARYAQGLAEAFFGCQAGHPMLTDDPALSEARMALAAGVQAALADVLAGLLRVTAPTTVEGALAP